MKRRPVNMARGFSIVEMMVALTIGMVLILGMSTVFESMHETALLRQNMSSIQDNQRMAMLFVNNSVNGAGSFPSAIALTTDAATQFPINGAFSAAGQTLVGSGAGAGADTYSVRFTATGGSTEQGCSPQLTANDVYTDVFTVAGGYLTCAETDNTASSATSSVKLVGGLAGMTVLYGVDTTKIGSATEYLTGDQVTASSNWLYVKTVQVTLMFADPLAGTPGHAAGATVNAVQTILRMAAS